MSKKIIIISIFISIITFLCLDYFFPNTGNSLLSIISFSTGIIINLIPNLITLLFSSTDKTPISEIEKKLEDKLKNAKSELTNDNETIRKSGIGQLIEIISETHKEHAKYEQPIYQNYASKAFEIFINHIKTITDSNYKKYEDSVKQTNGVPNHQDINNIENTKLKEKCLKDSSNYKVNQEITELVNLLFIQNNITRLCASIRDDAQIQHFSDSDGFLFYPNLSNIHLEGIQLSGIDIVCVDLTNAKLNNSFIKNVNFINVNLTRTNFSSTCDSNTMLYNVTMKETCLISTNISKSFLLGLNIANSLLHKVNLSFTNLNGAKFQQCHLQDVNFNSALGDDIDFRLSNINSVTADNTTFSKCYINATSINKNHIKTFLNLPRLGSLIISSIDVLQDNFLSGDYQAMTSLVCIVKLLENGSKVQIKIIHKDVLLEYENLFKDINDIFKNSEIEYEEISHLMINEIQTITEEVKNHIQKETLFRQKYNMDM